MELFAKTVKRGLVFKTERGVRTPQEIWQLPLTGNNDYNLKTISRDILKDISLSQEEDLVTETSIVDETNQLRLEVLKFIIADKKAEKEASEQAMITKQKRERLLKRKAELQDESFKELTEKEVEEQLALLS